MMSLMFSGKLRTEVSKRAKKGPEQATYAEKGITITFANVLACCTFSCFQRRAEVWMFIFVFSKTLDTKK